MKWLFTAFCLLMGLDYAITSYALGVGLEEGNPLGAWMFTHNAAAFFKIAVVLAILGVASLLQQYRPMKWWLGTATAFMGAVCINNILAIARM